MLPRPPSMASLLSPLYIPSIPLYANLQLTSAHVMLRNIEKVMSLSPRINWQLVFVANDPFPFSYFQPYF